MFLIQRCLMYQHTLNGCDEVRRRQWNTLQEDESEKKKPAKNRGASAKKVAVIDMEMGDMISDSTAGPFAFKNCLLYTSPSPRDRTRSRMPSSA